MLKEEIAQIKKMVEIISGMKNYTKRQLGNLLKKINKDDIIKIGRAHV